MRILKYRIVPVLMMLGITVSLSAEDIGSILGRAAGLRGTPYRAGGISPGGFDCSGFVTYLYRPTLPSLPRISRDMARAGSPVAAGDWRPGDLLFYATGPDTSRINHVALWYGNGQVIHSISDGPETGVVITPADSRYWSRRYVTARRVLPVQSPAQQPASPAAASVQASAQPSPWDSFDGLLRGDYDAWRQADQDEFEAYKRQNG